MVRACIVKRYADRYLNGHSAVQPSIYSLCLAKEKSYIYRFLDIPGSSAVRPK
jgi:hypothetical protein